MNQWVQSKAELKNFITTVLLCSPDKYPRHDFLLPDEQLTLDMAFDILCESLEYVQKSFNEAEMMDLRERLERIRQLYKDGEIVKAAHQLQDFDKIVFPGRFANA